MYIFSSSSARRGAWNGVAPTETRPSPAPLAGWKGIGLLLGLLSATFWVGTMPAHALNLVVDLATSSSSTGACSSAAGDCSLGAALQLAQDSTGADTIRFDPSISTVTVNAALPSLTSTDAITIQGTATSGVTIQRGSGTPAFRLFTFSAGTAVNLSDLAIRGGSVAGFGGAISNAGTLSLTNCTLANNAAGGGGALSNFGGTITLSNCTFSENTAQINGAGNNGGAINNSNNGALVGRMTLDDCSFTSNRAGTGGAIWNDGEMTLRRGYFEGNTSNASGGGGAIHSLNQTTIENATFFGNSATGGNGGAIINDSILRLNNVTFAANSAPRGSGIFNVGDSTSIANSLFDGASGLNVENGPSGAFLSGGFNISDDGSGPSGSSDRRNLNPGLVSTPANNGGKVKTLALATNSPALDGGNSSLSTDARGAVRPFDFNNVANFSGGNGSDVGAFEDKGTGSPSLIVTTTADEDNGTSDPYAGTGTSLREALARANSDGVDSTITFSPAVFEAERQTITLGGTELAVGNDGALTIETPKVGLALSGNKSSRILEITSGAQLTMARTYFLLGNASGSLPYGGAIFVNGGLAVLSDCSFAFNSAIYGSAIYGSSSTLTLSNCTFTGNIAQSGYAICVQITRFTLDSCTIAGNLIGSSAAQDPLGGQAGVFTDNDHRFKTTVRNSIIAGNTGGDFNRFPDNLSSGGSNVIGVASIAFNGPGDQMGVTNPGLAGLGENGGPVPTRALLPGSVALDRGDTTLATDARGMARAQNEVDDVGAFEALDVIAPRVLSVNRADVNPTQSSSLAFTVTFSEGVTGVDASDFAVVKTGEVLGGTIGVTGSDKTYTVTMSGISGTGTVGLNLVDNDSIIDAASNKLGGTEDGNGNFIGEIYKRNSPITVSIGNAIVAEGNTGTGTPESGTNFLRLPLTLSSAVTSDVTVSYQTANGTATAGSDFIGTSSSSVTIPAGQTSGAIVVPILGDKRFEANETLTVTLTSVSGAALGTSTATGTITNDDQKPTLSINSVSQIEGNSGTSQMIFTLSLSAPSDSDTVIPFNTQDGSGATGATAGSDYVGVPNGSVTIPAGQSSATLAVTINGDTTAESDETFSIVLGTPSAGNATLSPQSTGAGTLLNDESAPAAATVPSGVSVLKSGLSRNRSTNRLVQTIIVQNGSGTALIGPVYLAVDSLTGGTLYGAIGTTVLTSPAGSAYRLLVPAGVSLPTGANTFYLEFVTSGGSISYTARVLQGPGTP
jgi:hypothetical protein